MAETTNQPAQSNKTLLEKEGKYLTFALANEEYGLEILKVREIIGYMDITAVPQTPAHVKGVINLRGQVIPVIDLRAKFGMDTAEVTEETCIIVVEIAQDKRQFSTGIVVDRVQEVLDIAGQDIEEAPQFDSSVNTDFILGMGKVNDSVKILLDIDEVLSGENLTDFSDSAEQQVNSSEAAPEQTDPAETKQASNAEKTDTINADAIEEFVDKVQGSES